MPASVLGARVLRGPDWDAKDQDAGHGHLGTVIAVDYDNGQVSVIWDNGREMQYRASEGIHELRIYDSGPLGVCHKNIKCSGCKVKSICGLCWRCLDCEDIYLCSKCYMADKHKTTHIFGRVDTQQSPLVKVPPRKDSVTRTLRGLLPGAKVMRGPQWKWRDSDGGEGTEGMLKDICDWGDNSYNGAGRVEWQNKNKTVERYRIGGEGEVDLLYIQEGIGGNYYPEHLPPLDIDHYGGSELQCGDKVEVRGVTKDELKRIQKSQNWDEKMTECLEGTGSVIQTIASGLVRVQYQTGNLYTLHRVLLTKVYRLEKGDLVRIMKDKDAAFNLQQGHGGWSRTHDRTLGKLGRVVHIDSDGDVSVSIGGNEYMFSPVCCDLVDANSVTSRETIPSIPSNLSSVKLFDPGDLLSRKVTQLDLTKASTLTSLVKAAGKGSLQDVKDIFKKSPEKLEQEEDGMTPLQIACHKGHEKVVKYLLEVKANVNKADSDDNTPLHFAISGEKAAIVNLLLENRADHSLQNKEGQSPLHIAVNKKLGTAVNSLVRAGCDFCIKDNKGNTPLHDAMKIGQESIITLLMKRYCIDFEMENKEGYNVLQWAVHCNCKCGVEQILSKCGDTGLMNKQMKSTGHTALHLAAKHNCRDCALLLVTKGRADTEVTDNKGQTPLHLAVCHAHSAIVELLMEFDVKVNIQDKEGNTPLHLTQLQVQHHPEQDKGDTTDLEDSWTIIACILLEHGALIDIPNKEGKTPHDLAPPGPTRTYLQRIAKTAQTRLKTQTGSSGMSLPLHWTDMQNQSVLYVTLDPSNVIEKSEFDSVAQTLLSGLKKRKVVEIIRIQNRHLWELYAVKKKQLEAKYGKGNENEVSLFHGTKSELAFKICEENFDFRIAGENVGAMYGKGAYFATDPSLSDTYCSDEEKDGLRYMLVAKVLAGKMTYGSPEMQKPPEGYDSVVDYPAKPRIYCIFDFNQLYPEYLIKYR